MVARLERRASHGKALARTLAEYRRSLSNVKSRPRFHARRTNVGFKLSCILVNERHDGYIGEIARSADTSKHNRARAPETFAALGMAKGWESLGCPTIMTPLKEDQIDRV